MKNRTAIKPYKCCKKCGNFIVSGTLCEDCKPMTNGDMLRQMTDEQLVEYLNCKACELFAEPHCDDTTRCNDKKLQWLCEEVEEDAGTD